MKLNERMLDLRKSNNLSQEDLASKINVTRQTISNWELGETSPSLEQAKEIAKLYNVSLDYLVGNDNIVEEKINNVEKLSGIMIKMLKVIFCILIIGIVVYIIKLGIDVVNFASLFNSSESAVLNCSKDSDEEMYKITYNKKSKEITGLSGKDIKDNFFYEYYINIYGERIKINYYEDSNADELIKNIKNAYEKNNGKCNISYYDIKSGKKVNKNVN